MHIRQTRLPPITLSSGVKQITISFDFFELIFIQLLLVQLTALYIDSCNTDTSVVLQISNSVMSSTYLYKGTCDSRSLMYNKNISGQTMYPVGARRLAHWRIAHRRLAQRRIAHRRKAHRRRRFAHPHLHICQLHSYLSLSSLLCCTVPLKVRSS